MFKKLGSIINPETIPTEYSALQKSSQALLTENLEELGKFAETEAPKAAASQENALKGLKILSEQIKAMIK